ncbi:MAG: PHP domain-containing protein [bacterium]|nr:PHP domain-containing protein [bacterium]
MDNLREKLKNFAKEDYINKKVNLHIHTIYSDGEGNPEQILTSAKESGYKLISITDHNTVDVHKLIKDDILLTGVEFDCWAGYVFVHLLAYGIDIAHPDMQKFYSKGKNGTDHALTRLFAFRNIKELIKAIHSAGGIAVLAHPACCWALSLERLIKNLIKIGLDGVEVYYPYSRFRSIVKFHSASSVKKIADKYPELIQTGGNDFHGKIF